MAEPTLRRPWHRRVWRVLEALDARLLDASGCFFGGGTRVVLELGEYRESRDVDFLCSDRAGYRQLRGAITQRSFGELFAQPFLLLRNIRSDMYGIRTFLDVDGDAVKFEIVSEGRIDLSGGQNAPFPVPVLDQPTCVAEKLLANADRGRDRATHSRDGVDLAFMRAHWDDAAFRDGLALAQSAYGDAILRELDATVERLSTEAARLQCAAELGVSDTERLEHGLSGLRSLL